MMLMMGGMPFMLTVGTVLRMLTMRAMRLVLSVGAMVLRSCGHGGPKSKHAP